MYSGIILYMRPAKERWRYTVTPSLIGWTHTQNDPCVLMLIRLVNLFLHHLLIVSTFQLSDDDYETRLWYEH